MTEYLSVTEYAKLHGKDSGNIRKLLASGRIEGQKVGNQWIINKDTPYPPDKREKSGKYRNMRKRMELNKNKELMITLSNLIPQLCSIYGDMLTEVMLYGSYARGTQSDESDVDIAIFLTNKPSKNATSAMIDCVSSYELEYGKVLSVIDIEIGKYNQWKDTLPFYKNIQKEGIILWKAAA